MELWKPDIINMLVKLDGISYHKAVDRWFEGYLDFDQKIYEIIQYIIKNSKGGCCVLLNDFGRFVCKYKFRNSLIAGISYKRQSAAINKVQRLSRKRVGT